MYIIMFVLNDSKKLDMILDGWNKRTDRYLKYNGRETFIRALKPTFP